MDLREKSLYHQIHPAKLVVDWSTALASSVFFWQHRLVAGLLLGLCPPLIATILIVRVADLERFKASLFGRYVARYMTRSAEAARLLGIIVFWLGAWYHVRWLLVIGMAVILLAWARGKLWPGEPLRT